ncbi:hypothetical protein NKJ26_03290 [Mesorhizobium sp. M0152]|uniref:hypothetical protein n=1 Tax=Mesorhizobium sp. M0152 TaxID=2956898 RepID=UPI0033362BFE
MKLIELTNGEAIILVEPGSKGHEKATANGYEAKSPKAKAEPAKTEEPASTVPVSFAEMSVVELKAIAAEHNVDLGAAAKKAEIVAVLEAAAEAAK